MAPTASAAPSVTVHCESGGSKYVCDVYTSSGTVSAIRWYINGYLVTSLNDQYSTGLRGCGAGASFTVKAVVTDATGSGSGQRNAYCNGGPWP